MSHSSRGAPSAWSAASVTRTRALWSLAHIGGKAKRARWTSGATSPSANRRGARRLLAGQLAQASEEPRQVPGPDAGEHEGLTELVVVLDCADTEGLRHQQLES